MEVSKIIFLAIFEIALVHFVVITNCTKDDTQWKNNLKRSSNFRCSPQPRSFQIEEVVDAELLEPYLQDNIEPSMVVLHRCDSQSGCCKKSLKCGPIVTEDVNLTFMIFKSSLGVRRHRRSQQHLFLHASVTNHTECSCQSSANLPK